MAGFLIYGANGYTGSLIAREAAARGHGPILAGRNSPAVSALARELKLPFRIFALEGPAAIDAGIKGIDVVLHCAGPFAHTSKAMVDACLRSSVDYLDITGEVAVFEALAARDAEAKAAGVMLLPGVGFDVVPSDCLAAHLKRRLPGAAKLALAFLAQSRLSRGTATTIVENLHQGGLVRRGGVLTPVPAAWKTRLIDLGTGPVKATTIPWGDLSTAYHSTGIPDIEVYRAVPGLAGFAVHASRYLGPLLGLSCVQGFLKRRIQAGPAGPSEKERARGRSYLWGEATDDVGRRVVSRLRCPEPYTLTTLAAMGVVERILAGETSPGFQTPSRVFGADFVLGLKGVVREDEKTETETPVLALARPRPGCAGSPTTDYS